MKDRPDYFELTSELYDFLAKLSDFTVCVDKCGIIQYASKSSKTFLKLPTELLHESIQLFIHPEDTSLFFASQEKANERIKKQLITCRLLCQKVIPV